MPAAWVDGTQQPELPRSSPQEDYPVLTRQIPSQLTRRVTATNCPHVYRHLYPRPAQEGPPEPRNVDPRARFPPLPPDARGHSPVSSTQSHPRLRQPLPRLQPPDLAAPRAAPASEARPQGGQGPPPSTGEERPSDQCSPRFRRRSSFLKSPFPTATEASRQVHTGAAEQARGDPLVATGRPTSTHPGLGTHWGPCRCTHGHCVRAQGRALSAHHRAQRRLQRGQDPRADPGGRRRSPALPRTGRDSLACLSARAMRVLEMSRLR